MEKGFGVNVFGYITGEFGLGEAVRLLIKALKAANVPVALMNYGVKTNHQNNDKTFEIFSDTAPYLINLVLVGPSEARKILTYFSNAEIFTNCYTIYYLNWESEYFPQEYVLNISYFDEIWVPTTYCKEIISKYVDVPVNIVRYPIEISLNNNRNDEADAFYDKSKFNFLFMFDYNSTFERKNPLNLIKAFAKAFGTENESVMLTIKTSSSKRYAKEKNDLISAVATFKNVKIVEKIFEKETLHHIIKNCDSYISLHRSEGFGLTMAEAMYFAKPVIATNYSGNLEFMNQLNSFLVQFTMIKVDNEIINYDKNTIWSNPDINHAAQLLKRVRQGGYDISAIAQAGQETILNDFSVSKIGSQIKLLVDGICSNFKIDKNKNNLINVFIENEIMKNELHVINKSKLIGIILSIKLYFRNRKKRRKR